MRIFLSCLFGLLHFLSIGQEIPPMMNFDPNVYKAGNQNWMITQAHNKNIYIANSSGLLQYNGADWHLYPMPNKTIVRSTEAVGDLIFTGAYMDIGYWKENPFGVLEYTSLLPLFPEPIRDGEQFWHMEQVGEVLVFQSFEGLYSYDINKNEVRRWELPVAASVTNLFKIDDTIYFQLMGAGLFGIHKGSIEQVIPYEKMVDVEIMHLYKQKGSLHLVTQSGQIHSWNGDRLEELSLQLPPQVGDPSIFSALNLPDGSLVLGTIENGLLHLSPEGEMIQHFNQEKGYLNNTVLSLYLDGDNNLWTGLDNGLSVINLQSPFNIYRDFRGEVGSVYTSYETPEYIYLGTNQGLFYKEREGEHFQFMEGTNGQVWSLGMIDGVLYCGHNKGTFRVEGNRVNLITPTFGTWRVEAFESKPDYFVQGHYNGISLLRKEGNAITAMPLIEGFPHSSKFIETQADGSIWIGHEHKGVFRLELNEDLNAIASMENYAFDSISGITSSLVQFQGDIYYSTTEGIFQYNQHTNSFSLDNPLQELLGSTQRTSGRLVTTANDQLWAFENNLLYHIDQDPLGDQLRMRKLPLPENLRSITRGFENLTPLEEGYLIGLANGYLTIHPTPITTQPKEVRINRISKSAIDQEPRLVSRAGEEAFHYKTNNLQFSFSIPEFKEFLIPSYSYRLIGLSDQWSNWSPQAMVTFENLPHGSYEFQVRGRSADLVSSPAFFEFTIARPWYWSFTAWIVYAILLGLLLLLVHRLYKRRHQRLVEENQRELRMKHLEAERRLIQLQNEQLEKDVASKNKEVAISAMSLIKKNEALARIKEELLETAQVTEVRGVVRKIDQEISQEDNWEFFREAFDNADRHFFKKVKDRHPDLTANDLKLCAYLRLNLSSKEIAPLLNISVKSVEIRRYRLRKKMELDRNTNLTDYIIGI